jgi:hypothetical protein
VTRCQTIELCAQIAQYIKPQGAEPEDDDRFRVSET